MNLTTAIKLLKQGAILRDFNHDSSLFRLSRVQGMDITYANDNGHTYVQYTYTRPASQVVSAFTVDTKTEPLPDVDLRLTSAISIPCDLWLPQRQRFTQGNSYMKIADVFNANGERLYVLTHSVLGGKLYRKPEYVRLQETSKRMVA
jgi:hypothetical protein